MHGSVKQLLHGSIILFFTFRRCEEGGLPDEAISNNDNEIASGEVQERPRNDGSY